MRKISLFALLAALSMGLFAEDLCTETTHVTWSTPLQLDASLFANAQPGQKIVIDYTDAKEMVEAENKGSVIEFKVINAHFDHLAGSREALRLWDNGTLEHFLTPSAVDSLKAYGLEIVGNDFTITKVTLEDGKELKDGYTVWTGYFWADNWSTLELYWNGYAGVDWSKASAIRFYSEAKSGEYVLNFLEAWGDGGKIADQNDMTDGEGYKELALTDDLRTRMANATHWMIQFNKEALDAFNVTDIVLVMEEEEGQGIENAAIEGKAVKFFEDGQLVIIKNGVKYNALGAVIK